MSKTRNPVTGSTEYQISLRFQGDWRVLRRYFTGHMWIIAEVGLYPSEDDASDAAARDAEERGVACNIVWD